MSVPPKKTQKSSAIMFESDDTEGSDLSYESSADLEQEAPQEHDSSKRVQLFKEEMTRFFINHPELKNQDLVPEPGEDDADGPRKGFWGVVASDILNQTKRNSQVPSIEAFAKRLTLYRNKIERSEIIDVILKEQAVLLRQIENEVAKKRKRDNSIHNSIQEKLKKETGDVTYYSWRKNKQLEFRIDKAEQFARSQTKNFTKEQASLPHKSKSLDVDRDYKAPNLEPKTDVGRQLYDELRKCADEFTAKKTVINFLAKYRETVNKEFASKPSLLQQGQKYYSEESKEFVLLYPNPQIRKKLEGEYTKDNLERMSVADDTVSTNFLKTLTKIANGNLMAYWKSLQDKRL